MPYCSECGTVVDGEVKFCPECGAPIKKRKKGAAAVTPSGRVPSPKVMPGEIRPTTYKVGRADEASSRHEVPASEILKDRGEVLPPAGAKISRGERTAEERRQMRKTNLTAGVVAGLIFVGIIVAVPWMVLGYPIWEIGGGWGRWSEF